MKHNLITRLVCTAAFTLATLAAHAATDTVTGSNFANGSTSYATTFADGVKATFTADQRTFEKKTQAGYTGVGIAGGRTAGEIDIGESITGSFSKGVNVSNITLGLLFDGPEYRDVNEVAQITAHYIGGGSGIFTLTATGVHTAIWSLATSGVASIGSGAIDGGTGVWSITNPFGNKTIKSLAFTAAPGIAAASCGKKCDNQSDYTFISMSVSPVTAVPEPETYAMLLAGLGLMGAIARRRKST